jgi:hypothetical protein
LNKIINPFFPIAGAGFGCAWPAETENISHAFAIIRQKASIINKSIGL